MIAVLFLFAIHRFELLDCSFDVDLTLDKAKRVRMIYRLLAARVRKNGSHLENGSSLCQESLK